MTPRQPGGVAGSCGWQASRTLFCVATGTTRDEEIVDPLPVLLLREVAREAGRGVLSDGSQRKASLSEPPRPASSRGAGDADDVQIVFGGGDAGRGESLDEPADRIDLPVPLGALPEQDVGAPALLDRPRVQRQLDHVEDEAEALDPLAVAQEVVERPMVRAAAGSAQTWRTPSCAMRRKSSSLRALY